MSIIASCCLALWLISGSVSQASSGPLPDRAVTYLKDHGLYDSLQNAISSVNEKVEWRDQGQPDGDGADGTIKPRQAYRAVFPGQHRALISGVSEPDAIAPMAINSMFFQQQKLLASDGDANDFFGNAVAISGDTLVVGASPVGAVYVFVRVGGVWQEQQKLTPSVALGEAFGNAVAIDGNTLVVGAFAGLSNPGSAYVFVRVGGVWQEQQRLLASDGVANDNFGISVGISGNTVIVGARFHGAGEHPQQGSAYVFVRASGVWSQQQHLTATDGGVAEFFGDGVAISGDTIVVAAAGIDQNQILDPGSAYVYLRTSGVWSQQQRLTPANTTGPGLFGSFVTISGDTIIVGALFDSAAYVFVRAGGVWQEQQRWTKAFEEFGISASISGDTLVVGARHFNGSQGAAYVFVNTNGVWSEQQMLTASDGADNARFGNSVAISGDTIVVGASFDQVGKNLNQGSAYIFMPNGPPTITASSVTIQQGRAVIGASIASVNDNETSAALLSVSVVAGGTATGITLTNLANIGGAITANLAASCTATGGTLRLRVTDTGGLMSEADLSINVTRNDPPVITCSDNLVKSADPGQCSAVVTFSVTASDDCDGALIPICTPPSGAIFAKGITTITCTATDTSNNSTSCWFTVTVTDTQKPTIVCPASLMVLTARPGDATAIVSYVAPSATDNCAVQSVVCNPPSGSSFPLGTTTVICAATDTSGNTTSCTFTVTVYDIGLQDDSNPATVVLVNSSTGEYRFCYSGTVFTGTGSISRQGSTYMLSHNATDRRVSIRVNGGGSPPSGTALLQTPPGATSCTITDRDIRNNSCQCQ